MPQDAEQWKELGNQMYKVGRFREALEQYAAKCQ